MSESESQRELKQERADADRLAATGIVGDRQAMAYSLREIHNVGRSEAAEIMDTSRSNVDTLLADARSHVGSAHDIVAIVGRGDSEG